jgi:hypothetical protein
VGAELGDTTATTRFIAKMLPKPMCNSSVVITFS